VANCRLRDHISIHECFEAVRKYDNIILQDEVQGGQQKYKIRRMNNNKKQTQQDMSRIDSSYHTYAEWQKLTPEQRSKVLELREREKQNKDKEEYEVGQENDSNNNESVNRNKNQNNRKCTQRQKSTPEDNNQDDDHIYQGVEEST
jgi:hypothetical protein